MLISLNMGPNLDMDRIYHMLGPPQSCHVSCANSDQFLFASLFFLIFQTFLFFLFDFLGLFVIIGFGTFLDFCNYWFWPISA